MLLKNDDQKSKFLLLSNALFNEDLSNEIFESMSYEEEKNQILEPQEIHGKMRPSELNTKLM